MRGTTEGLQDEGEYEDSDEEIELENEKVKKKKVETSSGMAGQLHPDWKAVKVGCPGRRSVFVCCSPIATLTFPTTSNATISGPKHRKDL